MPVPSTWLVGAGSGDPSLLAVRAAELLADAEFVFHAPGLPSELFEFCSGAVSPITLPALVLAAREGKRVVSLVSGDPRTSSLGLLQATVLKEAGIPFGVVPGISTTAVDGGVGGVERFRFYDGPLVGKTLLLPRAVDQGLLSARAIRRRGADAVILPLIAIVEPSRPEALDAAVSALRSYDWLLLTSANGTERLLSALLRRGLDARAFGDVRIGAIGPETAAPLGQWGLHADLVSKAHVAEEFALALLERLPFQRALLVRAEQAREVLPSMLRARGVEVEVVAAYRTESLSEVKRAPLSQLLGEKKLDAILVTSSSMARALADTLGDGKKELLRDVVIASIGPITTQTLVECGMLPQVEASVFTMDGLLDALENAFASSTTAQ